MREFEQELPKPERFYHTQVDYKDWINLEDWLRTKLTTQATQYEESLRRMSDEMIRVVAGVDNYANPLTANDCVEIMKVISEKYLPPQARTIDISDKIK